MKKILTLLLTVMLSYQLPQICKQNFIKLQEKKSSNQLSETEQIKACFASLIQKEQYESIDTLQQSLDDEEEKIIIQLLTEQIKRLQSIEQYVIQTKTTCEPVLKWAQNQTHIFAAAKLSHRWDSPPCSKSVAEKYELSNSTLTFINVCLVSNAELKFFLQQKLYKSCKQNLDVKKDGVGTYFLTFQKQQAEIWPYLFGKNVKIPIWNEIMNRNTTLKAEFQKMLNQIDLASTQPKSDE